MPESITPIAAAAPASRALLADGAEQVFWETASTTEFETPVDREMFQWRYFGYYLEREPELLFVATEGDTVLGYICGVADTRAHRELYEVAPHVAVFDDLYDRYPAHLHINLTAASRGRGLGGRLVASLESAVAARGAGGMHLVTSPGARNVRFYSRAGYVDAITRPLAEGGEEAVSLLFLGKRL